MPNNIGGPNETFEKWNSPESLSGFIKKELGVDVDVNQSPYDDGVWDLHIEELDLWVKINTGETNDWENPPGVGASISTYDDGLIEDGLLTFNDVINAIKKYDVASTMQDSMVATMTPKQLSYKLRRIAAAISNSKKPNKDLVIRDLKKLISSISK